jgi:uncharacterized protein
MTAIESKDNQKVCLDMATGDVNNLKSSVYKLRTGETNTLDCYIIENNGQGKKIYNNSMINHYQMPRKLDWDLFKNIYDIKPQNYEQLISIPGVGPATVRALSLIGELIYGTKASWQDPVKYNFAHGGKDGVPYPVARKIFDKSITFLSSAIEGAEIEREERIQALKKLANYSKTIFNNNSNNSNEIN